MKQFCLVLLLFAGSLFAQNVAYVNMEKVFESYYKTVTENIKFEEERQNFLTGMNVLRDEFENTRKDYNAAVRDAKNDLLGEEAQKTAAQKAQALAARLEQKQDEIMRYRQQSLTELDGRQQAATQAIVNELTAQVKKYASEKGFDLVYEVSGRTMNRVPVLLVYPEDKEITDAVVKVVNAGHEQERDEAKARLEKLQKESESAAADAN